MEGGRTPPQCFNELKKNPVLIGLNKDKFRQHAENGPHIFLNKATVAEKPKVLILLLDPCHNAPEWRRLLFRDVETTGCFVDSNFYISMLFIPHMIHFG